MTPLKEQRKALATAAVNFISFVVLIVLGGGDPLALKEAGASLGVAAAGYIAAFWTTNAEKDS